MRNDPEYRQNIRLKEALKLYKMSVTEYKALVALQHGLCRICHQPPKLGTRLHVDHDHQTGYVRGLLCRNCNLGLGNFGDSIERLLNAVEYLR